MHIQYALGEWMSIAATPSGDSMGERGDFSQREKSVAGVAQEDGKWQTWAEIWVKVIENKCVPVLFLPVGIRGELGSSEFNADPWRRPRDLSAPLPFMVQYHGFHIVLSLLFLPVMSQERPMGSYGRGWGGGEEEASRVSS